MALACLLWPLFWQLSWAPRGLSGRSLARFHMCYLGGCDDSPTGIIANECRVAVRRLVMVSLPLVILGVSVGVLLIGQGRIELRFLLAVGRPVDRPARSRRAVFWTMGLVRPVDRQAKRLRDDWLCIQGDDAQAWLATL